MQAEYNVTDLSNGFTVLTESQTFPGSVHMGKWVGESGSDDCDRRGVFPFKYLIIINADRSPFN